MKPKKTSANRTKARGAARAGTAPRVSSTHKGGTTASRPVMWEVLSALAWSSCEGENIAIDLRLHGDVEVQLLIPIGVATQFQTIFEGAVMAALKKAHSTNPKSPIRNRQFPRRSR